MVFVGKRGYIYSTIVVLYQLCTTSPGTADVTLQALHNLSAIKKGCSTQSIISLALDLLEVLCSHREKYNLLKAKTTTRND